jgi:asparagine synthase (glutamine-hydrolysing)
MMARHSSLPVNTYSIGFDTGSAGAYYNELPFAAEVARLFKTRHKEILVRPDVARLVPKLLWHMDEPIADSAFVTTYLVAEFARKDVTVILSGVGGDEILGGYRRYLGDHYGEIYRHLPEWMRRRVVRPLADLLPSDRHSALTNLGRYAKTFVRTSDMPAEERYRSYVQVFGEAAVHDLIRSLKNGHRDSLAQAFAAISVDDPVNRMMAIDIATQLPNDLLMLTDKMTMAASIECRVPLLNHTLVEFAASMPASFKIRNGRLKHILKVALEGILPPEIINRKKRGFGAPMGAWLKNEMAPLMLAVLSRESVARRGLLDWRVIERTIGEHQAGREDHTDSLLALVNLEIWARIFLDRRSHEDVALELREVVPA